MALETRRWIFARVDDKSAAPASCGHMQAPGAVARLAARLTCRVGIFEMDPGMGTAGEDAADIGMALGTSAIPHEMRARNFRSRGHAQWGRRTGNKYQSHARSQAQSSSGGQVSFRFY